MPRGSELKKTLFRVSILSLVFAGAVVLGGRLSARPTAWFDDMIRLEFVVIDDETSLPVKDATLRLIDPFGNESDDGNDLAASSDDRGTVAISRDFELGQLLNNVKIGNQLRVCGWRVIVAARGYQTSTTPLFEHTGEVIASQNPKVTHPNIRLRRRTGAIRDSRPECDTFVYRYFGMEVSVVIYGDKFEALLSCPKLCSHHTPWFEVKRGDVKTDAGVLQLNVQGQEAIRRRDGEEAKWLQNNLVRVKWGNRQYLVPREQGIAFCNAVNLGEEPRDSDHGDFALGEGQEVMPVTGRPEVPEQWSGYLLKAPVRGEVTELLPDFKAKVNVGGKQGLRAGMELVPTEQYLFSDMEIVSVTVGESVIRTKYPDGRFRKIQVGDIVSSHRPPSKASIQGSLFHR
jgi:hypothetical protein